MIEKQTRRTFTKEFKLDVINQSEKYDNITELAANLGLRPELIYRWRAEVKTNAETSFPGKGIQQQTPDAQKIAALQRELANVRIERDILKKAMGIFTNPHK